MVVQNQDSGAGKDPSAIIDLLMKNPELIKMFASALSKNDSSAESVKSENENNQNNNETDDSPDIEVNSTAKVKDNPLGDLSSQLPLMMNLLRPMLQNQDKENNQCAANQMAGLLPLSKSPDKKTALLLSLKPFLSEEKGEIINYIVTFEKISEMLKDMK